MNEEDVLKLYRNRKITLQRAAAMLSVDIWDMLEKIKRADILMDYSTKELSEDLQRRR